MKEQLEKIALLALAGASVIALAVIAVLALRSDTLDPNAASLEGVIVTGLIAFSKDIVAAIRGYSMSAQLGKVTDQLAASGPAQTTGKVEIVNDPSRPVPVEETAP